MKTSEQNLHKYHEACKELRRLNPAIAMLRTHDFMAIQLFNDACSAPPSEQRAHFQHVIDFCIDIQVENNGN